MILPLELGLIKPAPLAILQVRTRPDGIPDGVHTGGVYFLEGEAWKPLDCRPYINCDHRAPTEEADCLQAALDAGIPLFPKNWRIEERNGRRWLVRPICQIMGHDFEPKEANKEIVLQVESSVQALNNIGWCIGDHISLGFDPAGEWFIVDLSCAHKEPVKHGWADERDDVHKLFDLCGYPLMTSLRNSGRAAHHTVFCKYAEAKNAGKDREAAELKDVYDTSKGKPWVYGSFYRPLSRLWASMPEDVSLIYPDNPNWTSSTPHTWILSRTPLDPDTVQRLELKLAYFPWHEENNDD